jgi:hypothetical protein
LSTYGKGQKITPVVTIQRSSGAAWPGEVGEVIEVTGDGYRIRFVKDGFVATHVKDHEIKAA